MKKLNKIAMLFATAALATAAGAQTVDNWRNGTSELVWKNGTNELCWSDASWTPATAAAGCDGAIVAKFQEAEMDYLLHSESGSRTIAENYVGLPLDFGQ